MFTEEIYDICGVLEEGCKDARRYLDALSPTKHAVGEEVIYEESLHEVLATFNQGVNPDRYTVQDENGEIQKVLEYELEVHNE